MASIDLLTVLSQRPLGLVFDLDGTLCLISATPDTAQLWPGVAENLDQARHHAHIAILSGRATEDSARIVNLEGLTYIGIHGLEWSRGLPGEQIVQLLPEARLYVDSGKQLFDLLETRMDELPGVILQRKAVGGSVHYRLAPDLQQTRAYLFELLTRPARRLRMRLTEGREVIEILAPLEINKGTALHRYVQSLKLQGVIFAGDDRTDLDAVLKVEQLRREGLAALSIIVQHNDTLPALLEHGDIVTQGVEHMAELLQNIVTLLRRKPL